MYFYIYLYIYLSYVFLYYKEYLTSNFKNAYFFQSVLKKILLGLNKRKQFHLRQNLIIYQILKLFIVTRQIFQILCQKNISLKNNIFLYNHYWKVLFFKKKTHINYFKEPYLICLKINIVLLKQLRYREKNYADMSTFKKNP